MSISGDQAQGPHITNQSPKLVLYSLDKASEVPPQLNRTRKRRKVPQQPSIIPEIHEAKQPLPAFNRLVSRFRLANAWSKGSLSIDGDSGTTTQLRSDKLEDFRRVNPSLETKQGEDDAKSHLDVGSSIASTTDQHGLTTAVPDTCGKPKERFSPDHTLKKFGKA